MLNIRVVNERQNQQHEQVTGLFEFGRGPERQAKRFVIEDNFVSRDHLQVEELPNGLVRVQNLSQRQALLLDDGTSIASGASGELALPLRLPIGKTIIQLEAVPGDDFDRTTLRTITQPIRPGDAAPKRPGLSALGSSPAPEAIANWLENVIALQRSPASPKEFYQLTARLLVELVGVDLGMVLLLREGKWEIAGHYTVSDKVSSRFSRTLVNHVLTEPRTFYQDMEHVQLQADSLMNIDAVVVSPIFGLKDEVAGVLYGSRTWTARGKPGIRPLEAQVVQLLASSVGANLARTVATRTRLQFEQFFSPELVRELERDPRLLEGRHQEVTILVSDLRGFTSLSERLGPETTCRIIRDIMERLSDCIATRGGVIVDYAGDGILAMWNAPVAQDDHVARACRTALAMLDELPGLNARWEATVGSPLQLGIGLNTGLAQVGNTGSSRKLKYGPHGLTVNVASRVQDATKKTGAPLLMTRPVREKLPPGFTCREVGEIQLAGLTGGTVLYELCDESATLAH